MHLLFAMVVRTLFSNGGQFEVGFVEIRLMPGIPQLHVLGQPDAQIRECGIKLKSALRSLGLQWPKGHQIVVNLRPSHFKKTSPGVELAIALAFLNITRQLPSKLATQVDSAIVYGEFTLDGRVYAPHDLPMAHQVAGEKLLSGNCSSNGGVGSLREGNWWQIQSLQQESADRQEQSFDWDHYWERPSFRNLLFHPLAAQGLCLAAHSGLNFLIAGPQGTGKSTWAEALYALTAPPEAVLWNEREQMFGEEQGRLRWRPFERPHHSVTPLGMIGGGSPLVPGVISRAHGGLLVMDEFLEFNSRVLEALREPIESGWVEHARRGSRVRFPASFQLVATTNLCPCGRFDPTPEAPRACTRSLTRCRSVCDRLSGPVLDRFDVVLMSHSWAKTCARVSFHEIRAEVEATRAFALARDEAEDVLPEWVDSMQLGFRRRRSLLRVARALADRERSQVIESEHFSGAFSWVDAPMAHLQQLFG